MFENRTEAGERLAEALRAAGVAADLVLAVPRGGLPVGRAVADALDAPLDVVVAAKVGAPGNPELAIGAVAGDGSLWLDEAMVARLGVEAAYVAERREAAAETAREKVRTYRTDGPAPDVAGKRVVVVDDGVATGATALAAIGLLRSAGPARLVFAAPVVARDSLARLRDACDEVVAVETPAAFGAVGAHYRAFGQVSDQDAVAYLRHGDDDGEGDDAAA